MAAKKSFTTKRTKGNDTPDPGKQQQVIQNVQLSETEQASLSPQSILSPMDLTSLQSLGVFMFFDDVSPESTRDLSEFLIKANCIFADKQPLTIFINSPGGSVYHGFGIIDLMEASRLPIQTVAIGSVCSMGSIIFTSGTRGMRVMSRNAYIMTHQFSDWMEAKYHEFVAHRKHHDELHNKFVQHFVRTTKMSEKQVKDILLGNTDKWITAKEALKYGLCDLVKDPWSDA
jgi:ATP-dependent Clp endopeptidase proteolytic subunit ClpP